MTVKAIQTANRARNEKVAAVAYRINSLLHTMRAIGRHEDQLCTMMTEIRSSGGIPATLDEELRDVLEQMPGHEYLDDIDAVRNALSPEILAPAATTRKASPKTPPRGKKAARSGARKD